MGGGAALDGAGRFELHDLIGVGRRRSRRAVHGAPQQKRFVNSADGLLHETIVVANAAAIDDAFI